MASLSVECGLPPQTSGNFFCENSGREDETDHPCWIQLEKKNYGHPIEYMHTGHCMLALAFGDLYRSTECFVQTADSVSIGVYLREGYIHASALASCSIFRPQSLNDLHKLPEQISFRLELASAF
jgi:hypothetical protein